jgi:hypothetical protein
MWRFWRGCYNAFKGFAIDPYRRCIIGNPSVFARKIPSHYLGEAIFCGSGGKRKAQATAACKVDGGSSSPVIIDSGYNPNLICIGRINGSAWIRVNSTDHKNGTSNDTPALHMGAVLVYHN